MTPIEAPQCALHDLSQRWNEQRWEEQSEKNKELQMCLDGLRTEIISIKSYIAMGIGIMAAIQMLSPIIFKVLGLER